MKIRCGLAILIVLFLGMSPVAAAIGQTDKEVQAVAEPILDAVLTGLNDGNYALYAQYFDSTMKNAIPEKKFLKVREDIAKKMGKYQSRTYLGFLKKANLTLAIWKARFSGSDDDVLVRLVLSPHGDKVEVAGLWFQ